MRAFKSKRCSKFLSQFLSPSPSLSPHLPFDIMYIYIYIHDALYMHRCDWNVEMGNIAYQLLLFNACAGTRKVYKCI